MQTKAIVITGANRAEFLDVEIPSPEPGEVLVRSAFSCISQGTELRCMSGKGEAKSFPYLPGYALVGVVEQTGAGSKYQKGERVCVGGTARCEGLMVQWGGHVGYAVRSESALVRIPDNVTFAEAAAARLAAIAYHGVRSVFPVEGKTVAVLGLGPIGQFSARIYRALGADVVGGDISSERVALLRQSGAKAVDTRAGIRQAFQEHIGDGGDVLVDATGVRGLIPEFLSLGKEKPWDDEPRKSVCYVVQGSYVGEFCIPYLDAFMKEAEFYFPRDFQKPDLEAVLTLISERRLCVSDVISKVFSPANAQEAYDLLLDRGVPGAVCFDWTLVA